MYCLIAAAFPIRLVGIFSQYLKELDRPSLAVSREKISRRNKINRLKTNPSEMAAQIWIWTVLDNMEMIFLVLPVNITKYIM